MRVETRIYINSNPYLKKYLKEHSYWHKLLNRNPESVKEMEEEMQKKYKLTTEDKIAKLGKSIDTIASVINIFK